MEIAMKGLLIYQGTMGEFQQAAMNVVVGDVPVVVDVDVGFWGGMP